MGGPKDFSNSQFVIAELGITPDTRKLFKRLRKSLSDKYVDGLEGKARDLIHKWTTQVEDAARSKVPIWSRQLRDEMFKATVDPKGNGKVFVITARHTQSWGPNKPGSAALARFLDAVSQRRSKGSDPQFGFTPAASQFSRNWVGEAMAEFHKKKAVWR